MKKKLFALLLAVLMMAAASVNPLAAKSKQVAAKPKEPDKNAPSSSQATGGQTFTNEADTFSFNIPSTLGKFEEEDVLEAGVFLVDEGDYDYLKAIAMVQLPKDACISYGITGLSDLREMFGVLLGYEYDMTFSDYEQPSYDNKSILGAQRVEETVDMGYYTPYNVYINFTFLETSRCYYLYIAFADEPVSQTDKALLRNVPGSLYESGVIDVDDMEDFFYYIF